MFPTQCTIRWYGRLLSGWCLLATLLGAAFASIPGSDKPHSSELIASVAPPNVDFSGTALQQSCQHLIHANLQGKAYLRLVTGQEGYKFSLQLGRSSALRLVLPNVTSLLALGIALRL